MNEYKCTRIETTEEGSIAIHFIYFAIKCSSTNYVAINFIFFAIRKMVLHSVPFWSMFRIVSCVFCCFSCGISVDCAACLLLFSMCLAILLSSIRTGLLVLPSFYFVTMAVWCISCQIIAIFALSLVLYFNLNFIAFNAKISCDCILSKWYAPKLNPISQFTSATCVFEVWHDFCHCVSSCHLTHTRKKMNSYNSCYKSA